MAVLVEGISVVVKRRSIDSHLRGGWQEFLDLIPNRTMCTDGELVRVGFMSPDATGKFVEELEDAGLVFRKGGRAVDLTVIDQQRGTTVATDWVEFAHLQVEGEGKVAAAWLFDEPRVAWGIHRRGREMALATPDGWTYKDSLSAQFTFVPIH